MSKSSLTYRLDDDVTFAFPMLAFLLTPVDPDDSVVLVDTGMSDGSDYMRHRGRTVGPPGSGPDPLVAALNEKDISPTDIDVVVLTHLHHDHAANINLFDDAEFFVQRLEIDAACDPLPALANTYVDGDRRDAP